MRPIGLTQGLADGLATGLASGLAPRRGGSSEEGWQWPDGTDVLWPDGTQVLTETEEET